MQPVAQPNHPGASHHPLRHRPNSTFNLGGTPYVVEKQLGTGAYGVVTLATNTATGNTVALKKIPGAFQANALIMRALREIRILRRIQHENIVAISDMFITIGSNNVKDIYLAMDLMETDLHQIIHSTQQLTERHNQYFLYQLLKGLKYLHSVNIVHRDLKPANLLINGDCLLKIADFGMARSIDFTHEASQPNPRTQYVMTRWYRAPELLLALPTYDTKVDIWSAGCIFAELIMRRQLFPGQNNYAQIKMLVHYLGTPDNTILSMITQPRITQIIQECGYQRGLPWSTILSKATPKATALIQRMMPVAPWDRCTADQALEDDYLEPYHDPDNEPIGNFQISIDTDEIERLKPQQLREALANEVHIFQSRRPIYAGEVTNSA